MDVLQGPDGSSREQPCRASAGHLGWVDIKNVSKANVSLFSAPYKFSFFPAKGTVTVPLKWTFQVKWSMSVCICACLSMCTCLATNLCHCNRIPLKWISTHSCAHSDHEPNDDKLFLFPDSLPPHKCNEFWMWQEMKFIFHHNKVMSVRVLAPSASLPLCECTNSLNLMSSKSHHLLRFIKM